MARIILLEAEKKLPLFEIWRMKLFSDQTVASFPNNEIVSKHFKMFQKFTLVPILDNTMKFIIIFTENIPILFSNNNGDIFYID